MVPVATELVDLCLDTRHGGEVGLTALLTARQPPLGDQLIVGSCKGTSSTVILWPSLFRRCPNQRQAGAVSAVLGAEIWRDFLFSCRSPLIEP